MRKTHAGKCQQYKLYEEGIIGVIFITLNICLIAESDDFFYLLRTDIQYDFVEELIAALKRIQNSATLYLCTIQSRKW